MATGIASLSDVPVQDLPGRRLRRLVTKETGGAERLSIATMDCPPGSVLRPMHSHREAEEVLSVLEGEGEAMIEGETTPFKTGYAVLFPANSKHMLRNTGHEPPVTASVFSSPTSPSRYGLYDGVGC